MYICITYAYTHNLFTRVINDEYQFLEYLVIVTKVIKVNTRCFPR